jgi:hypothetical protein
VKEEMFVPHVPMDIDELKWIITAAIETIDRNMLEREWDELDCRLDLCLVMNGADIKQLWELAFFIVTTVKTSESYKVIMYYPSLKVKAIYIYLFIYIFIYIVTCLVEYQNYRTVLPKELGKVISAFKGCKAGCCNNESTITLHRG